MFSLITNLITKYANDGDDSSLTFVSKHLVARYVWGFDHIGSYEYVSIWLFGKRVLTSGNFERGKATEYETEVPF